VGQQAPFQLETVKATLDCARADVDFEDDRMKVLDGKLSTLATFSGLSVSISASLGANVLVAGKLCTGFTIALGATLTGQRNIETKWDVTRNATSWPDAGLGEPCDRRIQP
jgi:hypothetical protein